MSEWFILVPSFILAQNIKTSLSYYLNMFLYYYKVSKLHDLNLNKALQIVDLVVTRLWLRFGFGILFLLLNSQVITW